MNTLSILKYLNISKEIMKSWEIADKYMKNLEKEMSVKYGENKWAALSGALQGDLSGIFIILSSAYPEAFERILKNLNIQR